MQKIGCFILVLLFLCCIIYSPLTYAGERNNLENLKFCFHSLDSQSDANSHAGMFSPRMNYFQQSEKIATGLKSYKTALILSGIFPGAGEIYLGSYKKGAAFACVEVLCWTLYITNNNKGDDIRTEFRAYADENWSESVWRNALITYGINEQNLSHQLPDEKTQQYYEMIGKYDQFAIGWNDCNEWEGLSENRLYYEGRRYEHNKHLKRAITMTSIVLLNRVASFIDTIISVKKHNENIRKDYSFQAVSIQYADEIVPLAPAQVKTRRMRKDLG